VLTGTLLTKSDFISTLYNFGFFKISIIVKTYIFIKNFVFQIYLPPEDSEGLEIGSAQFCSFLSK
jgi:hypothetical protein